MVTCSMVQLGANTILNYLKPFLLGLLKSSVKYILVYKILMHSSHCSVCKLLAFRRRKVRETRLQPDGGMEKVLSALALIPSVLIPAVFPVPRTSKPWSQTRPVLGLSNDLQPARPSDTSKLQVRRLE